jgi:hypothetical protein
VNIFFGGTGDGSDGGWQLADVHRRVPWCKRHKEIMGWAEKTKYRPLGWLVRAHTGTYFIAALLPHAQGQVLGHHHWYVTKQGQRRSSGAIATAAAH